jgi:hypothetical protein
MGRCLVMKWLDLKYESYCAVNDMFCCHIAELNGGMYRITVSIKTKTIKEGILETLDLTQAKQIAMQFAKELLLETLATIPA